MSADFSKVFAHLADDLQEHADRDGLRGVERAVFIDRGGHAPSEDCPTSEPPDPHHYTCQHPDAECSCTHPEGERR